MSSVLVCVYQSIENGLWEPLCLAMMTLSLHAHCSSPPGLAMTYSTAGVLPNNSIVFPDSSSRIGLLECISGSLVAGGGQWIGPDGTDLTAVSGDPFEVTVGGAEDPGTMRVESTFVTSQFSEADNGVYSCLLPDESGLPGHLSVGIYAPGFNSMWGRGTLHTMYCMLEHFIFKFDYIFAVSTVKIHSPPPLPPSLPPSLGSRADCDRPGETGWLHLHSEVHLYGFPCNLSDLDQGGCGRCWGGLLLQSGAR